MEKASADVGVLQYELHIKSDEVANLNFTIWACARRSRLGRSSRALLISLLVADGFEDIIACGPEMFGLSSTTAIASRLLASRLP